jgi:hypothetical protein
MVAKITGFLAMYQYQYQFWPAWQWQYQYWPYQSILIADKSEECLWLLELVL